MGFAEFQSDLCSAFTRNLDALAAPVDLEGRFRFPLKEDMYCYTFDELEANGKCET